MNLSFTLLFWPKVPASVWHGMRAGLLCGLLASTAHGQQAPLITSVLPARNALAAPRTAPIAVTFNQPLSTATGTQQALKVYSQQAGGKKAGTATVSGNTLTLAPSSAFKPGETVFASVTSAAQNSSGQNLTIPQVFQFTTATALSTGQFSNAPDVPLSNPNNLITGDVDGDGDLDLVANTSTGTNLDTVSIRLNKGNGTFENGQRVAVRFTYKVALGDVDGDGDLDLITSDEVCRNNGSGLFGRPEQTPFDGAAVGGTALGDVDGDGDLDLLTNNYVAIANPNGGFTADFHVRLRLNNGSGSFSEGQHVPTGFGSTRVAVGDVNGDGALDLLASSATNATVSVRLNTGFGTFATSGQEVSVATMESGGVLLGDADSDGDLDLFAVNTGSTVTVFFNNGQGTFADPRYVNLGSYSVFASLGDVDGDGDLDLLAGGFPNSVSIRLNDGSGNFTGDQNISVTDNPRAIAVGDLNSDGTLDFATANSSTGAKGSASIRLNKASTSTDATYRLNAGGGALTTSRGQFAADQYYSTASSLYSTSSPIAGTTDQALYQTERYSASGLLSYALPVSNGTYTVVLHFAEIYWQQPGQRLFDVRLESNKVLDNYDIVKKVGPLTATTETFTVTVTDGVLNLDLSALAADGGVDQAKLSALEVLPVHAAYRLNAGGGALTTSRGQFAADQYYSTASSLYSTDLSIGGTADQALYQTERYSTGGVLNYSLPVSNGQYTVVLHFAEIYWNQPGQRLFDVSLEGNKVLDNYDIVKKVGPLAATTETFSVSVTDGVLNVDLSALAADGGVDQAKVSAIEVLSGGSSRPVGSKAVLATTAQPGSVRELSAYPNPSTGHFTLHCTANKAQAATLLLTDRLGRVVQTQAVPVQAGVNAFSLRAPALAQGLYQLTLRTADGQRQSQKVLIQP